MGKPNIDPCELEHARRCREFKTAQDPGTALTLSRSRSTLPTTKRLRSFRSWAAVTHPEPSIVAVRAEAQAPSCWNPQGTAYAARRASA